MLAQHEDLCPDGCRDEELCGHRFEFRCDLVDIGDHAIPVALRCGAVRLREPEMIHEDRGPHISKLVAERLLAHLQGHIAEHITPAVDMWFRSYTEKVDPEK